MTRMLKSFIAFFWGLFARRDGRTAPAASIPQRWDRPRLDIIEWTGVGKGPPLSWSQCHPRTRAIFKAELVCANGHALSLRGHSIEDDGTVMPSVVCTVPGCDFHDFIRLDAWNGGRVA